jgi:hypothetical protein
LITFIKQIHKMPRPRKTQISPVSLQCGCEGPEPPTPKSPKVPKPKKSKLPKEPQVYAVFAVNISGCASLLENILRLQNNGKLGVYIGVSNDCEIVTMDTNKFLAVKYYKDPSKKQLAMAISEVKAQFEDGICYRVTTSALKSREKEEPPSESSELESCEISRDECLKILYGEI